MTKKIKSLKNVITTTQAEANVVARERYETLMEAIAGISKRPTIKAPSVVEPVSSHRGVIQ